LHWAWRAYAACARREANIAIVVRQDVPLDNLPFGELRKILLGDRQFWSSNVRVTLLVRAPGAREREVVQDDLPDVGGAVPPVLDREGLPCRSSQRPAHRVFERDGGGAGSGDSGRGGFPELSQVPRGLKVLKINGAAPGDKGYSLR
jgi:hypothetical protein